VITPEEFRKQLDKELEEKYKELRAQEDNHPCELAWQAGIAYGKKNPNASKWEVFYAAKEYDDEENFIDGFYSVVGK
jgi:hypothetical protein